jgi:flagellar hook-basal body complex protein FliE
MAAPLSNLGALRQVAEITLAKPGPATAGGAFGNVLTQAIHTVEQARSTAAGEVEKLLTGESGELHNTVLAAQRAEMSFELFLQVRNKAVQAYQEIMRMQI